MIRKIGAIVEKMIIDSSNTEDIKYIICSQGQRAIIMGKDLIKNVQNMKLELYNFNVHNKRRMRADKSIEIELDIVDGGKKLCKASMVGKEINIEADISIVSKVCKVLESNMVFKYQIDRSGCINIKITSKSRSIGAARLVNNIPGKSRYNFEEVNCTIQRLTVSGEYSQEINGLYACSLVNEGVETLKLYNCRIKYYVDEAYKKVYLEQHNTRIEEIQIAKEYYIENIIEDTYRIMALVYDSVRNKERNNNEGGVELVNRTIDFSESNILYEDGIEDLSSMYAAMIRTTNKWLKEGMKYDIGIVCKRKEALVLRCIIEETIGEPVVINGKDEWLRMIERTRKLGIGRLYNNKCHIIIVEAS